MDVTVVASKCTGCPGCGFALVLPLFGLLQVAILKKADASQYSQIVAEFFWSARLMIRFPSGTPHEVRIVGKG